MPGRPSLLLIPAALALGVACAPVKVPVAPPPPRVLTVHAHALRGDCVTTTDAAEVRCGAQVAVELLCFVPEGRTCRALAVRYSDGEVAWLYRPPAFDPSHPEFFHGPEEKDTLRAFGPSASWDGHLVWFGARTVKDRGVVHEYDVRSGELRTVEKNSEWKVWAAEPQHRAIPIGVAAAAWPSPPPTQTPAELAPSPAR
jgi:hypothetical protein